MDVVYQTWLERQYEEAHALVADSDVLQLGAGPGRSPPQRYFAHFESPTMIRDRGRIVRTEGFGVLIQFPDDYLRTVPNAAEIVALLLPANAFHPNVAPPFICTGRMRPGTSLREIVYQLWEMLTFRKMTLREDDALNHEACVWARQNMHLFPLEARPLRRRVPDFTVTEIGAGGMA